MGAACLAALINEIALRPTKCSPVATMNLAREAVHCIVAAADRRAVHDALCSFIAMNAAARAVDILTLPDHYTREPETSTVARFTDKMRMRLDRFGAWAGYNALDKERGMTALPTIFTPEQVASHIGWSPRKLREFAREIGACRILGNRMVLTLSDIDAILEASRPCPSPPKSVPAAKSATIAALSTGKGYAGLLELRRKQSQNASSASSKKSNGKVILKAREPS